MRALKAVVIGTPPLAVEHHDALGQREQREVFALADVASRVKAISHLSHQDVSGPPFNGCSSQNSVLGPANSASRGALEYI